MYCSETVRCPGLEKGTAMKRVEIYISSLTGNTRKIGRTLEDALRKLGYEPVTVDTGEVLKRRESCLTASDDPDAPVVICFWCRKAGMDDLSFELVRSMSGRRILAFGTMGSYTDGPYGNQVRGNVSHAIEERNRLLGLFLCRGRIDEKRTEKRRSLPVDHPHYLTDEAYERHLTSRSHPDEEDLKAAAVYLTKILATA